MYMATPGIAWRPAEWRPECSTKNWTPWRTSLAANVPTVSAFGSRSKILLEVQLQVYNGIYLVQFHKWWKTWKARNYVEKWLCFATLRLCTESSTLVSCRNSSSDLWPRKIKDDASELNSRLGTAEAQAHRSSYEITCAKGNGSVTKKLQSIVLNCIYTHVCCVYDTMYKILCIRYYV